MLGGGKTAGHAGQETPGPGSVLLKEGVCKLQDERARYAGVLGQCLAVWAVEPGTGVVMLSAAVSAASLPSLYAVVLRGPLFVVPGVCVAHGVPAVAARRVGRFLKLCAWVAGVRSGLGPALRDVEKRGGECACAPRLASLPVRLAAWGRTCKPRACLLHVLGRPQQQRCC